MKMIWDKKQRKWVDAADYVPPNRVHLQSDWEPLESPLTGEVIGSRSAYYQHLKDHGCHIQEPGSNVARPKTPDRAQIRADVKRTLQDMGVVG